MSCVLAVRSALMHIHIPDPSVQHIRIGSGTFLRWHDELRRGGIALDRCAALKWRCCETVSPVFTLRKGPVEGAEEDMQQCTVCVRFAGLGGFTAGLAASVLPSSEAGSSGLRTAHGRSEGAKAASRLCVRLAGLGGCATGPANVPLTSEDS